MNDERLVRSLAIALDELASARTPDYLEAAIERASSTSQRPAWTFPERWLPMDLVPTRVPSVRLPWRQLGALALIALLIAAALAAYVGSQRRLPSPFGIAANGLVAYVDADGAILQADPLTGESEVLVAGPGNDRPLYSPDGSRLAYLLKNAAGDFDIVVAHADGQRPVVISAEPLASVDYFGWTPDNATIVISAPPGRLQKYDASRPSEPNIVSVDGKPLEVKGMDDFNANIQDIFRPPIGAEILFIGSTPAGPALFVANADGTNARAIIDPERSDVAYSDLDTPQWSPDGSRVAVALAPPGDPNVWRIHVLNADGSGLRELSRDPRPRSEGHASWSRDGTRVAFQRWINLIGDGVDVRPITVVGVDDGVEIEVGIVNVDGYAGWSWSPDGTTILEVAQNIPERRLQIAPVDGGSPLFLDATTTSAPSWQRTAP